MRVHQHAAGARKGDAGTRTVARRLTSKTHLVCDAFGRPLAFVITGGNSNDCTQFTAVMEAIRVPRMGPGRPRTRPSHVIGGKGYSSKAIRAWLRRRGIGHMVPERTYQVRNRLRRGSRGGRPPAFDKPHLTDTFTLSTDPFFVEKVYDVVGLYFNPPEGAVVLSVDEKSQIQALDRSQPVLPIVPGMPERRTHGYVRNGLTTLFAAFDVATGEVISSWHRRHRAAEFKKFLIKIDKEVPAHLQIHLICGNYGTHKTPAIKTWLARHPRFHMHPTPTGSSWINQVEQWFGFLADQKIRRGAHKNVHTLEADIRTWIKNWNADPKPFIWTKTAEEILESLAQFCRRISDAGH
ncbi:IS630 family transposase [Streptomyces sp. PRKS01-29]|nr:IS630 family transposase [Streptomyces sabulosicollis]MBI0293359.1 IS630 family transposase [Streptomyces sabulosicollis]